MTFNWTTEHASDLSGVWLTCQIEPDLYLCVQRAYDEFGYQAWLHAGGETIKGPVAKNQAQAQDDAVEMFYGWCIQDAMQIAERLDMAMTWER